MKQDLVPQAQGLDVNFRTKQLSIRQLFDCLTIQNDSVALPSSVALLILYLAMSKNTAFGRNPNPFLVSSQHIVFI